MAPVASVAALSSDDHATARSWKPVTVLVAVALTTGVLGFGIGASLGADGQASAYSAKVTATEVDGFSRPYRHVSRGAR